MPEEVCNYMAFEAAKQDVVMKRLLLDFQFPMSDTAVRITSSGRADPALLTNAVDDSTTGKFAVANTELKKKGLIP